jgi:hypothetical protein
VSDGVWESITNVAAEYGIKADSYF